MSLRLSATLSYVALIAVIPAASAQVYKCLDPATGKTTYADKPCQGALNREVDVTDKAVIESRAERNRALQRKAGSASNPPASRPQRSRSDEAADEAASEPAPLPAPAAAAQPPGFSIERYWEQAKAIGSIDMTLPKADRLANAAIDSQSLDAVEDALKVLGHHRMRGTKPYLRLEACHATLKQGHACL